jgi:hypothetical protein
MKLTHPGGHQYDDKFKLWHHIHFDNLDLGYPISSPKMITNVKISCAPFDIHKFKFVMLEMTFCQS